jgi:hypothetical protein
VPAVHLATEDELSECVGIRLLEDVGLELGDTYRNNGSGYLRTNIPSFRRLAHSQPVLLLTDLDRILCPSRLLQSWNVPQPLPENFLFRVVVRETEAWLLADRAAMSSFFGRKAGAVPRAPEALPDPKRTLLALAERSTRSIREDLTVRRGAVASQGLAYNARLSRFIREKWDPARAAANAPSLAKALIRLQELKTRLSMNSPR